MPTSSPKLLVIGSFCFNLVPSEGGGYKAYAGGEAPWTGIAASYAIRLNEQEIAKEQQRAKSKREPKPVAREKSDSMMASYLPTRHTRFNELADDNGDADQMAWTSTSIAGTRVTLLTTLNPDNKAPAQMAAQEILKECSVELLGSPSLTPIDVYKSPIMKSSNIVERYTDTEPFATQQALRTLATHHEDAQRIAIFNGAMLGNEKAASNCLDIAKLLRSQGWLILADLRPPMAPELVHTWAQTAHIVRMSAADSQKLMGAPFGDEAATDFLLNGAQLVMVTEGPRGSHCWWREEFPAHKYDSEKRLYAITMEEGTVHRILPSISAYKSVTRFKAGAAFDAGLALALIKFGVTAENLNSMLKTHRLMDNVIGDAINSTTHFLKAADKLVRSKVNFQPKVSRPIATGASVASIMQKAGYPKEATP